MAVATIAVPKLNAAAVAKRHPVLGFGAQLNTYVFTEKGTGFTRVHGQTQDLTGAQHEKLKAAVKDAEPGHCRIFVQRGLNPDSDKGRRARNFTALFDTLELAQLAGAQTVNLTWWGQGPYAVTKAPLAALDWPSKTVLTGWPHPGLPKWPKALTNPDGAGGVPGPRDQMRRFARIIHVARRKFPVSRTRRSRTSPTAGRPTSGFRVSRTSRCGCTSIYIAVLPTRWPSSMIRRVSSRRCGRRSRSSRATSSRTAKATPTTRTSGFGTCTQTWTSRVRGSRACSTPTRSTSTGSPAPSRMAASSPARPQTGSTTSPALPTDLGITKPIYITEYGVRFPFALEFDRPGDLNGVPMERSPESGVRARLVQRPCACRWGSSGSSSGSCTAPTCKPAGASGD